MPNTTQIPYQERETQHCPICWTPFTPHTNGGNPKTYCTPACRIEASRRRRGISQHAN